MIHMGAFRAVLFTIGTQAAIWLPLIYFANR